MFRFYEVQVQMLLPQVNNRNLLLVLYVWTMYMDILSKQNHFLPVQTIWISNTVVGSLPTFNRSYRSLIHCTLTLECKKQQHQLLHFDFKLLRIIELAYFIGLKVPWHCIHAIHSMRHTDHFLSTQLVCNIHSIHTTCDFDATKKMLFRNLWISDSHGGRYQTVFNIEHCINQQIAFGIR